MLRKKRRIRQEQVKIFSGLKSRYLIITAKTILLLLVLIFLSALGFWMFYTGSFFKVKTIFCQKGDYNCHKNEILLFNQAIGQNIFLLKTKSLAETIYRNSPDYKEVLIKKKLPDQLMVTIIPRSAFALLEAGLEKKVVVDEGGYVLSDGDLADNLPRVLVRVLPVQGEKISDEKTLQALKLIKLVQGSFLDFKIIDSSSKMDFTLFLSQGLVATFSAQKDLITQVDSLQYILRHSRMEDSKIQAIDLRFQKPVLKFAH